MRGRNKKKKLSGCRRGESEKERWLLANQELVIPRRGRKKRRKKRARGGGGRKEAHVRNKVTRWNLEGTTTPAPATTTTRNPLLFSSLALSLCFSPALCLFRWLGYTAVRSPSRGVDIKTRRHARVSVFPFSLPLSFIFSHLPSPVLRYSRFLRIIVLFCVCPSCLALD